MKLAIRSIIEAGDPRKERITFRATSPTDVGDFMVTRNIRVGDEISIEALNSFWFPYSLVEKGDLVVLYTRKGESTTKQLDTGSTAHFFFWGIDKPIWSADDVSPVLMYIPEWTTTPVEQLRRKVK